MQQYGHTLLYTTAPRQCRGAVKHPEEAALLHTSVDATVLESRVIGLHDAVCYDSEVVPRASSGEYGALELCSTTEMQEALSYKVRRKHHRAYYQTIQ